MGCNSSGKQKPVTQGRDIKEVKNIRANLKKQSETVIAERDKQTKEINKRLDIRIRKLRRSYYFDSDDSLPT